MIINKNGSVFNTTGKIVAHQVNCYGVMGGGIALQVKKNYPIVFKGYEKYCKNKTESELLGDVLFIEDNGKIIANVFSQGGYNKKSMYDKQTDYRSLYKGLQLLREYAIYYNMNVALPHGIGCGLGGGDWNVVFKIIENIFGNSKVECEIWKYEV